MAARTAPSRPRHRCTLSDSKRRSRVGHGQSRKQWLLSLNSSAERARAATRRPAGPPLTRSGGKTASGEKRALGSLAWARCGQCGRWRVGSRGRMGESARAPPRPRLLAGSLRAASGRRATLWRGETAGRSPPCAMHRRPSRDRANSSAAAARRACGRGCPSRPGLRRGKG